MKNIKIILVTAFAAACSVSCDKFLDMQPIDQPDKVEDIFKVEAETERYLHRIYAFILPEWLNGPSISADGNAVPWLPASDEADVSFDNDWLSMINGTWNTSTANMFTRWGHFYSGIREANFFLQNLDMCQVMTEPKREQRRAEARFLRAYFYSYLMKMYGPVVLLGDYVSDPNDDLRWGRNTFEECVEYVVTELDEVSKILVPQQSWQTDGTRPTSGVALALKSRVLLYAASPLFNNRDGNSLYRNYKNPNGADLIPTDFQLKKWEDAAQAALDVIELNRYSLIKKNINNLAVTDNEFIDPYNSLTGVFMDTWNPELIWARQMNHQQWYQRCMPKGINNGWGGFGVTQQHVDTYAMNSGKYPINPIYDGTGYNYEIIPGTGYIETGWTNDFTHPWDHLTYPVYNMYVNREPRFYLNIGWSSMQYPYAVPSGMSPASGGEKLDLQLYTDGNSGPRGGTDRNYSMTGYLIRKIVSRENNPSISRYILPLSWSYIRLAEIYLNYTEAQIEADPAELDYQYWDELRARAGLLPILEVYPEAENDQDMLRDLIRRERSIELAFENHRFFDVRRWQIAEKTDNGRMWGMNISAKDDSSTSNFWQRTVTERGARVFRTKDYFFPIRQSHIDRDVLIEQSPYWK